MIYAYNYTHILSIVPHPFTSTISFNEHLASFGLILWLDRAPLWPCLSFWNLPRSPDHTVRTGTRAQSTSCNLSASQAATQKDTFKWIPMGQQVSSSINLPYHPYPCNILQQMEGWLVFVQRRSLVKSYIRSSLIHLEILRLSPPRPSDILWSSARLALDPKDPSHLCLGF